MLFLHVVSHLPHTLRFGPVRCQPAWPISKETSAMPPELTTTGISVMGEIPQGTHFCYFYETKQDLLDASVPFFQAGLENREFCLWIVYTPITEADALQALRESIPALDRHLAEGGIEILVHPEALLDGDIPEPHASVRYLHEKLGDALTRGYAGMRVAGSPACLQKANTESFREFERELGSSIAHCRMIALCLFPLAESSAVEIVDAARTHQFVAARREGDWEIMEPPEIRLAKAEITKLNAQLEERVEERTRALEAANEDLRKEIVRREAVEEDLRRQKEILQTIIDHVPLILKFVDKDGRIQMVNREWERVLGRTLDEIVNQGVDIYREGYPDPLERQRILDFVKSSNAEWADFKTTVKDGRVVDTSWAVVRLSDGATICIGQDISERKRTERDLRQQKEILQTIFDHLPVMVSFVDPNNRVKLVNREWERTLGWSRDEIRGQDVDNIVAENYPDPEYRKQVHEFILNSDAEWADFKTTVRDGRIIDTSWSILHLSDGTAIGIGQDITKRKQAERDLRQQKEILQTIFDHIPVMINFVDQNHRIKLVNREWERTLGWSVEEIQRQNIDILVEGYPDPKYRESVRDFVFNSNAEWADFKTTVRDGRVIDTSWAILHLSDGAGIGIGQDITKRKQAEEALRESEERFRQLAENIQDLFWIKTPDFKRVLYFSPEYENITGRSPQARYQDPDYQPFLDMIVPEDRERMAEVMGLGAQEEFDVEFRIRRPDGSLRWIHDRGFPVRDRSGRIYRIAGIAHDITERKLAQDALRESEERFRQLTENIHEVFWLRSPDLKELLYVSPMYEKVCGRSRESLYAADPEQVVHPEDRFRVMESLRSFGGQEFEIEYRIITKEGEVRWLRDRGFPIRSQDGQIYRMGGVAEDITDRKAAEDRLKASSEQLRALSASLQSAREEEATRIAHQIHDDMGGILTGLRWELEALEKMIDEPADPGQLKVAMRNKLATMIGLTDTTINVVRRIASELRPSILDDLGLVEAIDWQTQQFQARTGIECHCECSLQSIPLGERQSTAVFRIVQEGLTNILRHAQATRVSVAMKEEDGILVLKMSDNGRGITPAEVSNKKSLGLLGMRERAHLIGGQVDIAGLEGGGTTLHVRVPLGGGAT
jgi:PAS domain S-box-containing protein